jgi:hypothetical protein
MASRKTPPQRKNGSSARAKPEWQRMARPDSIDYRDRRYLPGVAKAPPPTLYPAEPLPVKHQGDTNACTGFALALVVEHLRRRQGHAEAVSPFMLYSMARRYDEFAGSARDEGSSLRGALKGWFKHGACRDELFPSLQMPPASDRPQDDWWFDAVMRPLGAYYRVDTEQIADMHAALNEAGVLYVSCGCHSGWDEGANQTVLNQRPAAIADVWQIPVRRGSAAHAGHAFAIVGYDERGFLVQNSWGADWGSYGYAILGYEDWIANAMDCWVAQLGVVTAEHRELSQRATLKMSGKHVSLAASTVLRNRELSPYIVNMGNDGQLSASGQFRTTPDDLRALAGPCLDRAREQWGLQDAAVDVCIFAHGGLVDESAAADVAARWIPALYENRVLPIFLMWETGFWDTLTDLIEEALCGQPRTAGAGAGFERWWNSRLESALARPGTAFWGEMKENADLISRYREKNLDGTPVADDEQAGAVLLYRHFKHQVKNKNVRMHFVGHSAGAIVGASMMARMVADGMKLESVSFMAPALRLDDFNRLLAPLLERGQIARYQQFSLTDRAEEDDPSCGPYRRSLLCLVSESFEGKRGTPILGMERFAKARLAALPRTVAHWAPERSSAATTHGAFDEDEATIKQVLRFIRGS